jgi:L-asparaginase
MTGTKGTTMAHRLRTLRVLSVAFWLVATAAVAEGEQALPKIVVLATGGTIAGAAESDTTAGYTSGQVGVEQLLAAVPQARKIAQLSGEQVANIGSQDMDDAVWLKLAKRVNELARVDDVQGIVITHGTDTIEETAYFLSLVVKTAKPVVMTGSMRPSTALSADGPLNFYNAVAVAADPFAAERGVLVVMNDWIHSGAAITKTSTTAVQTFASPLRGLIGTVSYGATEYYRYPVGRVGLKSEFSVDGVEQLPRVDIVYAHAGMDGSLIDAAAKAGAKGIVIAGVGNGNLTKAALSTLTKQAKKGVLCVRASRVPTGRVSRNVEVDDDATGTIASEELNPAKARVLLKLALLAKPKLTTDDVQDLFREY